MNTLRDLFLSELSERLEGEKQLLNSYPQLIAGPTCTHLQRLFQDHSKQTESHVVKVEKVFKLFSALPSPNKSQTTLGLIREAAEVAQNFNGKPALNAALIACAQKIKHQEIVSYGCLHAWAEALEMEEAAGILQSILDQEIAADEAMTELAMFRCNEEAITRDELERLSTTRSDLRSSLASH